MLVTPITQRGVVFFERLAQRFRLALILGRTVLEMPRFEQKKGGLSGFSSACERRWGMGGASLEMLSFFADRIYRLLATFPGESFFCQKNAKSVPFRHKLPDKIRTFCFFASPPLGHLRNIGFLLQIF